VIEKVGQIELTEMLRTFNCGIGMVVVTDDQHADEVVECLQGMGEQAFRIGRILAGDDEQPRVSWG